MDHPTSRFVSPAARALLAACWLSSFSACDAGDPADSPPDGGAGPDRDGAAPSPTLDAAPAGDPDARPTPAADAGDDVLASLVGAYAIRTVIASIDQTPVGEQHTTASSYGVAVIEPAPEGGLQLTERWCRMQMANDGILEMSITDQTVRAIPNATVRLQLSGPAEALTVYRPPHAVGLGATLADPESDPLPTDADDPRVVDMEGDGHPGMSVHFSGFVSGTVFAVRRERYDYSLTRHGDGRLVGQTVDTGEQVIIGASTELFDVDTESSQNPDLSLSPVALVPIEDEPPCDTFVERIDDLFPE